VLHHRQQNAINEVSNIEPIFLPPNLCFLIWISKISCQLQIFPHFSVLSYLHQQLFIAFQASQCLYMRMSAASVWRRYYKQAQRG